jgi:hypothetical protein
MILPNPSQSSALVRTSDTDAQIRAHHIGPKISIATPRSGRHSV